MSKRRIARDSAPLRPGQAGTGKTPLSMCPHCESPYVQPLKVERVDIDLISIELVCPECLTWMSGRFSDDEVSKLMNYFRAGKAELLDTYERLVESNMAKMAASFTYALKNDLIGPDDFSSNSPRTRSK